MKITANNEIKYTLLVPSVADLYVLAKDIGYSGKKLRRDIIAFVKNAGYDCVHFDTAADKVVLGVF